MDKVSCLPLLTLSGTSVLTQLTLDSGPALWCGLSSPCDILVLERLSAPVSIFEKRLLPQNNAAQDIELRSLDSACSFPLVLLPLWFSRILPQWFSNVFLLCPSKKDI